MGGGGGGTEEGEIIYQSLQCHHQNDFCIKMSSDESHIKATSMTGNQTGKLVH